MSPLGSIIATLAKVGIHISPNIASLDDLARAISASVETLMANQNNGQSADKSPEKPVPSEVAMAAHIGNDWVKDIRSKPSKADRSPDEIVQEVVAGGAIRPRKKGPKPFYV